jgi:hypothetical protein
MQNLVAGRGRKVLHFTIETAVTFLWRSKEK